MNSFITLEISVGEDDLAFFEDTREPNHAAGRDTMAAGESEEFIPDGAI